MEDYIPINENELAKNLNTTKTKVVEMLLRLKKLEVIDYQAKVALPKITYTKGRVEYFKIGKKHYLERKEISFKQVEAVVNYAENESFCRSNKLLNYFGETSAKKCGVCDVCLSESWASANTDDLETFVFEQLKNGPKKVDELLGKSKYSKELAKLLNFLTESGKLTFDGLFYSKQ